MSHITVIISKAAVAGNGEPTDQVAAQTTTYEYRIPIPHDCSAQQVGEIVKQAYKRLEGAGD